MGARLEVDRTCYTKLPITSLPSSSGRECRSRSLHSCIQGLLRFACSRQQSRAIRPRRSCSRQQSRAIRPRRSCSRQSLVPLIPNAVLDRVSCGSTSGTYLTPPMALKVRFENHLILGVRDSRRVRDTECLGHPSVSGTALISPKWVRHVIRHALHACHTAEGLSALLYGTLWHVTLLADGL
jgi:hypothetical protein